MCVGYGKLAFAFRLFTALPTSSVVSPGPACRVPRVLWSLHVSVRFRDCELRLFWPEQLKNGSRLESIREEVKKKAVCGGV